MGNLTRSDGNNLTSPSGNSLAVFIEGESGIIKLKDIIGNIQPLSDYVEVVSNNQVSVGTQTFATTTPNSTTQMGGIAPNTVLANKTVVEILEQMLVVYQPPAFLSFSIDTSSLIEVGDVTKGNKDFTWTTSNNENIQPNSLVITDVTANATVGSGLANDGIERLNIQEVANTVPMARSWNIKATNTQNALLTSTNYTVNSIYPIFYGFSNSLPIANQALINSGTKTVKVSTGTLSITFGATGQYIWFAHPSSSTTKTKWYKDAVNNANIGTSADLFNAPTIVSITTALWNNISYKIYISNNPTTTNGSIDLKNS